MKTKYLILLLILLISTGSGYSQSSKVDTLTAQRNKAVEAIDLRYKEELIKLCNDPSIRSNAGEMLKLQKILGYEIPIVADLSRLDHYFVMKSWYSGAGVEYHFDRHGKGYRKSMGNEIPMNWIKLPNGIVEIQSGLSINAPMKKWFFIFSNTKTALFGESLDSIINQLSSEKNR